MKKLMIWLLIATMVFSTAGLTGCADEGQDTDEAAQNETGGGASDETGDSKGETKKTNESKGLFMQVDKATGKILIRRPQQETTAMMGAQGSWTIFVYLCGTDLESKLFVGGSATDDVREMQEATSSEKVRFVIQTGGTKFWQNSEMDEDLNQRFIIEKGKLIKVDEEKRASMGDSTTLAEFLKWGVKNYPAQRMGVVLWDHGGGSIGGVCYDEYEEDCLTLREIDAALLSVYQTMTDQFEFIGMDACLMGTVEMANIAASYARYMYASEEIEPGGGWDYTSIGNFLAADPDSDGAELGKIVADSYYESCREIGSGASATMSVIDLGKIDNVVESFNTFAKSMYEASDNSVTFSAMSKKIVKADNFGGNNKSDGYTNMVDYGGILTACSGYTAGNEEALAALKDCVVYTVHGSDHPDMSGLSMYYPLEVQSQQELTTFENICPSPYYLSYVDKKTHGFVSAGTDQDYDDDTWFEGGFWSWLTDYDEDAEGDYVYEQETDEHWSYLEDGEVTGESPYITFYEEPRVDDNGVYYFVLDEKGCENAADVIAYVYTSASDGKGYIEYGETCDLEADWNEGYFADEFDGYWLSLPDGQNLATYVVDMTEDYIIYSSPVLLNDEETNLRIRKTYEGTITVEGAWDGIGDNGAAARDIVKIGTGDTIVPMYYCYDENDEESIYVGNEYDVEGKLTVEYAGMYEGEYLYAFCIDDIYGDYYMTDPVLFYVGADGEVMFGY